MNYGFNLEFEELDEDLQERKIDEVIESDFDNGEYVDIKTGEQEMSLDECLENDEFRRDARRYIEAHFPIYF